MIIRSRDKEQIDAFQEGPIYTISVNGTESENGPEYNFGAVGRWLYTNWSQVKSNNVNTDEIILD